MKDGYIKVAAITPALKVADVKYNLDMICKNIDMAAKEGAKLMVFPELSITGYSCQDLFLQDCLIEEAFKALLELAGYSREYDALIFVGLPLMVKGKLYNVAAAIKGGKILGFVPKTYLPNYNEFYEVRHFYSGRDLDSSIEINGEKIPVSRKMIFAAKNMQDLRVGAELCEDLWVAAPPSTFLCLAGADIIVNLSASNQIVGKESYRRNLVSSQSARSICGYIYASAGSDESSQDIVFSGHDLIAENGRILKESPLFSKGIIISEIDLKYLAAERRRMTTFEDTSLSENEYREVTFEINIEETKLTRYVDPQPFVPAGQSNLDKRCSEIIEIQAMGLKKRLEHIGCKKAVIGISGGLDSTLALLVTARAFDYLKLDRKGIIAVTMPGFGTSDRTYRNAVNLINEIGADYREISIVDSVKQHFKDIGQDINKHDICYENSQARERTQILMDLSNKENAIVIGTGDMSELALGWATYNGDHMSMYAVNASIPKTLVRYLVDHFAKTLENDTRKEKTSANSSGNLKETLQDILATPVSPELLPLNQGKIVQKTEDLVGPYELHDFFLYHALRLGQDPEKIFRLSKIAFKDKFEEKEILKWEETFYRRFFSQQFKRSCLPDGPKVGSVALSPRGDLRMPSDAASRLWLERLKKEEA